MPEEADVVPLGAELEDDPIEPFSDEEPCGHCFWCAPCVRGGKRPRQWVRGEELPEEKRGKA